MVLTPMTATSAHHHPPLLPSTYITLSLATNPAQFRPGHAKTQKHLIVRREELERLYASIGKLPLLQQQVLQLRVGDGLRFAEIAVLLNKREEAVRKVFSRTLALLRAIYDQQ